MTEINVSVGVIQSAVEVRVSVASQAHEPYLIPSDGGPSPNEIYSPECNSKHPV